MTCGSILTRESMGPCEKIEPAVQSTTQTGRAASEYTPELAKITGPQCGLSKDIAEVATSNRKPASPRTRANLAAFMRLARRVSRPAVLRLGRQHTSTYMSRGF